jgi:hypothetical protein
VRVQLACNRHHHHDLYLETAYDGSKKRRQSLLPFVKDDEPIDTRKARSRIRLSISSCMGASITGWTETFRSSCHGSSTTSMTPIESIFARLTQLSHECPLIFVGYGLADPHS